MVSVGLSGQLKIWEFIKMYQIPYVLKNLIFKLIFANQNKFLQLCSKQKYNPVEKLCIVSEGNISKAEHILTYKNIILTNIICRHNQSFSLVRRKLDRKLRILGQPCVRNKNIILVITTHQTWISSLVCSNKLRIPFKHKLTVHHKKTILN
jgi:hypothetical protein